MGGKKEKKVIYLLFPFSYGSFVFLKYFSLEFIFLVLFSSTGPPTISFYSSSIFFYIWAPEDLSDSTSTLNLKGKSYASIFAIKVEKKNQVLNVFMWLRSI